MQIKKLNEAFTSMYKADDNLTENIFEALEAINADEADTKVTDTDSESQAQKDDKLTEEQHHKETEEEKKDNDNIRSALAKRHKRVNQAKTTEDKATRNLRGILNRRRERLDKKRAERGELTEDRHHKITDDEKRDNALIRSAMRKRKAEQSKEEKDALDRNGLSTDRRTGSLSYYKGGRERSVGGTDMYDDKVNLVDKVRTAKSAERDYARHLMGDKNSNSYTRKYNRDALDNFQARERRVQNQKSEDRANLEWALHDRKRDTERLNNVDTDFEREVKNAVERRDRAKTRYSKDIEADNQDIRDILGNKKAKLNAKRGVTESKKVDENRPSVFEAYKNESVKRAQALHESIARRKRVIESLKEKRATKHLTEAVAPKHSKKPLITENAKMRRKPIKRK